MVNDAVRSKMALMSSLTRLAEDAWMMAEIARGEGREDEGDRWMLLASAAVREVLRLRGEVRDLSRAPGAGA